MDRQVRGQFQFGNTPEVFFQDGGFDLQLVFIGGMLVVAPSARGKIRAAGLDSILRSLREVDRASAREARLFFGKDDLHPFIFQHKREKHCFATSTFVGRQAGEAVTPINQLFDSQLQGEILC